MDHLSEESPGFITQVTLAELSGVLSRSSGYPRDACLEAGADFADALIESAMDLFGVTETVTFDQGAARALGWKRLGA